VFRRRDEPRPGRRDAITCIRCLEIRPSEDLDRLLWCEDCIARARRRATWIGLAAGIGLGLVLGLYIWFGIRPDLSLIPAIWLALLLGATYLGGRLAREFAYGAMRWQNRGAVEAVPPSD
jgi:hypothetical protein